MDQTMVDAAAYALGRRFVTTHQMADISPFMDYSEDGYLNHHESLLLLRQNCAQNCDHKLWKCKRFSTRRLLKEFPKKKWKLVNNTLNSYTFVLLSKIYTMTIDFKMSCFSFIRFRQCGDSYGKLLKSVTPVYSFLFQLIQYVQKSTKNYESYGPK